MQRWPEHHRGRRRLIRGSPMQCVMYITLTMVHQCVGMHTVYFAVQL